MISFDEAVGILAGVARPLGTETVALAEAAGRVLASPVLAAIDSPRADVSAMDGYAVRSSDLIEYPVSLRVLGSSYPGRGWDGRIEKGSCVRIFTGAPLPVGSDRIVIQEQVQRDAETVIIDADPGPATWVRPRGADFQTGDVILAAGQLLAPTALVAAAGADVSAVQVALQPKVAVLTIGDELVNPGTANAGPLLVPDSVAAGLTAFAESWGAKVVHRQRLRDDLSTSEQAAGTALDRADLVVVAGGASVGEHDYAKAMFEIHGLELAFSRISIRPGKPAWFGRARDSLILGLPGNPTSAMVTARLLLAPLLCLLQGRATEAALDWQGVPLATSLRACDARETFHRASLHDGRAALFGFQESHAQKVLAAADILIRQPAHSADLPIGDEVAVLRF